MNWDYFWFCVESKALSIMIMFWLVVLIGWRHR